MQAIVKIDPPFASITKLNVNIGRVPPLNLATSVGIITDLQTKLVSGGLGQLFYDKLKFERVVSVNVYF